MTPTTPERKPVPLITPLLNTLEDRAANIRNETLVLIPAAFVLGAIAASLIFWAAGTIRESADWTLSFFAWGDGFFQNFGTEMVGAVITIVLLEVMLARRRENEAEQREKERLILQMGSPDNTFAVEAVRQLRARSWLLDGSLDGAFLNGADLRGANLFAANLKGTYLRGANLADAGLVGARFEGATLENANFLGADLESATFDARTRLPDCDPFGSSVWRPHTDMDRFTDPDHPDFWRSDDPKSPAYRGDGESVPTRE